MLRLLLEEPGNMLWLGPLLAAAVFGLQLLLCFRARKLILQLVPALVLVVGFVLCLALFCGMLGQGSGVLDGAKIAATILAIFLGIVSLGVILGWLVRGGFCLFRTRRKQEEKN